MLISLLIALISPVPRPIWRPARRAQVARVAIAADNAPPCGCESIDHALRRREATSATVACCGGCVENKRSENSCADGRPRDEAARRCCCARERSLRSGALHGCAACGVVASWRLRCCGVASVLGRTNHTQACPVGTTTGWRHEARPQKALTRAVTRQEECESARARSRLPCFTK